MTGRVAVLTQAPSRQSRHQADPSLACVPPVAAAQQPHGRMLCCYGTGLTPLPAWCAWAPQPVHLLVPLPEQGQTAHVFSTRCTVTVMIALQCGVVLQSCSATHVLLCICILANHDHRSVCALQSF